LCEVPQRIRAVLLHVIHTRSTNDLETQQLLTTHGLSEACSNAVEHAQLGQGYAVVVTVGRTRCVVEVADTGVGMDVPRPAGPPVRVSAKRGRGLLLIRALTDGLQMHRVDPHGLAVKMIKT
jgi:serine/threonine-protein kinase RsbW